jgi:hypothetical protein
MLNTNTIKFISIQLNVADLIVLKLAKINSFLWYNNKFPIFVEGRDILDHLRYENCLILLAVLIKISAFLRNSRHLTELFYRLALQ